MSFDPNVLSKEMTDAGYKWADANATATQMEEVKKILLSQLALDFPTLSNAAATDKARAMPEYKEHIVGMCEARRKANRAQVRYKALIALNEGRRTLEATRRAEMGMR